MKQWTPLLTVWLLYALAMPVSAQESPSQAREVYLTFQYRGVVNVYVTAYYHNEQFYLPVSELFNILRIEHEVNHGRLTITGNYLGSRTFTIDFKGPVASVGGQRMELEPSSAMIREIGYFMRPSAFEKLFGLHFTVNFNNLTLDLQTQDRLPVVAQYEREQKRQNLDRNRPVYERSYYPLRYRRSASVLDGAFIDYNISSIYSDNSQLYSFSNAFGAELLGGDIQGNVFGAFSQQQTSFTTSGLRWRHVQRNNALFSSAILGQTTSEGITNRSITGLKLTNKPIESRLLYDRYVVNGSAPPESEVELYLNNRLVDFQTADQSGIYRFVVPLTYGSTNYSVRIFTPAGNELQRESRLQIPFDYIPPGTIDYSISAGKLQEPILGETKRGYVGQAVASVGLSNWLTLRGSSEYLTEYHEGLPSFTGTLNARLLSKYLLSLSANSENFYRLTSSVVYNSGASWSLGYDYNPGDSQLYNIGGRDHQAQLTFFMPLNVGRLPLNLRWTSTYQQSPSSRFLRYRADLNTRIGRLNVRLGYQDQQAGAFSLRTTSASRLLNSYTYAISRSNDIPDFFRGMFLRGQLSYLPGLNQFEEARVQLSNELLKTGRMQLSLTRNFLANYNSVGLNVTLDFNKVRSNTTIRTSRSNFSFNQNFRGSVGFDSYENQLLLNNRQQVGQASAAVRLFVDNNNDGTYQDSTDVIINDPAVRINRAGGSTTVKDGVNYITQLLPYYRYDMEINRAALSNPLLVPEVENFSFITDPNQYKPIEIPFYQSGVISGTVDRILSDSTRHSVGGLRLQLESVTDSTATGRKYAETIRTFSDGSFYTYEVPPGAYRLYVEQEQLGFLDAAARPDTVRFSIEALAEGDFVEGLQITLVPSTWAALAEAPEAEPEEAVPANADTAAQDAAEQPQAGAADDDTPGFRVLRPAGKRYRIQLASFRSASEARDFAMEAEKQTGTMLNIIYNPQSKLYGVRSPLFTDRNEVMETIISYYRNLRFPKSALVILQKSVSEPSDFENEAFIQLGAFSTLARARAFHKQSAPLLEQETAIWYNEKLGLYSVSVPIADTVSEKTADAMLRDIRSEPLFNNAFVKRTPREQRYIPKIGQDINFRFQIVVEKADDVNLDEIAAIINAHSDADIHQPQQGLIILDNISSWEQLVQLQQRLRESIVPTAQPVMVIIEEHLANDN